MIWWENTDNSKDQEALTKQQNAYIKAFYDNPAVLAHLYLIVANMSTEGMTASEACVAGRAQDNLLTVIRRNAGVIDELAVVRAEGNIARATRIEAPDQKPVLEGFNDS